MSVPSTYRLVEADTAALFAAARALIEEYGAEVRSTKPYYFNPIRGASYMQLDLGTADFTAHRT